MRHLFMVLLLLGGATLFAGERDGSLSELLAREESLYRSISRHYMERKDFSEELSAIHRLNSRLKQVRTSEEIRNLLAYIGLCEEELRAILAKPHTPQNAEIVHDLSLSVAEGSSQILRDRRLQISMGQ